MNDLDLININFNDLIPEFEVYYIDGDEIGNRKFVNRKIEYIRNPNQVNPNIQVELNDLPNPPLPLHEINENENQEQPPDFTKKKYV
jgi:hypothetical protein